MKNMINGEKNSFKEITINSINFNDVNIEKAGLEEPYFVIRKNDELVAVVEEHNLKQVKYIAI